MTPATAGARGRETTRLAVEAKAALDRGEPAHAELEALFRATHKMLRVWAKKLIEPIRSSAGCDVEDLVQVGAMQLPRVLRRYEPGRVEFATYLVRTVPWYMKRARDGMIGAVRVPRYALEAGHPHLWPRPLDGIAMAADAAPCPFEAEDRARRVAWALDAAGDSGRRLLVRRFGLGGAEPVATDVIAREMGITPAYVRVQQAAAIRRVRRAAASVQA